MAMEVFHSSRRSETSSRSHSPAFASSSVVNFGSLASSSANVKLHGQYRSTPQSPPSPSSSVRFSVEQRPESPGRQSMTVTKNQRNNSVAVPSTREKRTCMCSPTTHPGSFRCAYHKRLAEQEQKRKQQQQEQKMMQQRQQQMQTASSSSNRALNLRRSAMKNSLVRIGGVEGELLKRTLTTLIRPSSHQLRRREAFQPRPSRLSHMSKSQED